MPYIITTKRRGADIIDGEYTLLLARRAVATLEEAVKLVNDEIYRQEGDLRVDQSMMIDDLPESGGTVGPLPDGTVIEVERVEWPEIAKHVDSRIVGPQSIIDAYNAQ